MADRTMLAHHMIRAAGMAATRAEAGAATPWVAYGAGYAAYALGPVVSAH